VEVTSSTLEPMQLHGEDLLAVIHDAMIEQVDSEILRLIIEHDPEVFHVQDDDGTFLLHKACWRTHPQESGGTSLTHKEYPCIAPEEIVRLLIRLNPDALYVPLPAIPEHSLACTRFISTHPMRLYD